MIPIILTENENGTIFRYKKIPHNMFNFYILRKKDYRDGTSLWHLCVEIAAAPAGQSSPSCTKTASNYIKLESCKGTKEMAKSKLEEIIEEYK